MTDSTEAPAPVFFVVSATITVAPAPETAGAENALTVRSGPMRTVARLVLSVSVTSATTLAASARAIR